MKGTEQQAPGTSTPLTVDAAKIVFEGLLSTPEETEARETSPAKQPGSEGSQQDAELVESTGESPPPEADKADGDSEEASDETETTDKEREQPASYRVRIAGEEVEVTLDELLRGYSRTSDYTRKTQTLAEQRKQTEAESASAREARGQYANLLTQLQQAMETLTPQEPEWDKLRRENPDEFAATWADWQQHRERMTTIKTERERVSRQEMADQARDFEKHLTEERGRVFEALPDWKDSQRAKTERDQMVAFAKDSGFTDNEIQSVSDHRTLLLLRKAMLYDKLQAKRPEAAARVERVKAATPGPATSTQKRQTSETTRALQRLAKTGRVDDAAAAFLTMIPE